MTASQISAEQHGSAHTTTRTNSPAAGTTTPTLGWAVKRAILGIVIMTVTVAGAACLLYFTIDPEAEARAEGDQVRKPVAGMVRQVR